MKKLIAMLLALSMLALTACAFPGLPQWPAGDTVPDEIPDKPADGSLTETGGGLRQPEDGKQEEAEEPEEERTEPVTIEDLWDALYAVGLPEMVLLDAEEQFGRCGVDPEKVSHSIIAVCTDSGRMDELWLIEAESMKAAKEIQQLAESHLTRKSGECISSAPDQYEIVQQAYLRREGRYVILLVSPLVEVLRELAEELLCLPKE